MSLLMKALEKAAKDREGSETAPAAASGSAGALSLEPMPAQSSAARETNAPAAASAAAATKQRQPAQAAEVISAGRRGGGGFGAFMRERPLAVFGAVAGLVVVGYGGYVYLQLTNPGLFASQSLAPASKVQPTFPPPVQPPPATATVDQANATLSPLTLAETGAAATTTTAATAAATASTATKSAAAQTAATAAAAAVAQTPSAPAPTPVPVVTNGERSRDAIKVTIGNTAPVINPLLTEAYAALNTGSFDTAQRLYNQLLRSDPGNIDALLGLAAIATQQGNSDEATRRYLKVLELEPRNAPAQAGLIGILGRADPQAAETRVKQLISREPATAFLYFALGITYVDQKRWPDAQQAFFQAHSLQSDNPDYAYNLAVALEHIGQPKVALDYYRRALQLATAKGRADFSMTTAEDRIGKLEKAVR